jgi:hypothetical protein
LARRVLSPADLESMNINLVGGDPYGGACTLDQLLLWRPLRGTRKHRTPVSQLYHIGASTHPGAGLGGGSGWRENNTTPPRRRFLNEKHSQRGAPLGDAARGRGLVQSGSSVPLTSYLKVRRS